MRLIDTHAHIHGRDFAAVDDALGHAEAAGVDLVLTLAEDADGARQAIALAERSTRVLAAAGVHPHNAAAASEAGFLAIEEMARHPRVALVGEIGLDFYRDISPRDVQERVLRRQLAIATGARKPVALHTRQAHETMLPLLTEWSRERGGALPDGRPLGVMHYFSGDVALAQRYIDLGFMISVHTSVTHPKALALQDVAAAIPLEHLVLETDSPYGAPQRYRGKRNEPAYVVEAARKIVELKGITIDEVAEATTRNALRLLGVGVAAGGGR